MCLIALAHRASPHFPLIVAANRDEDYLRPTLAPHFWREAPEVYGGRDALAGGSWLAISREGRFAAVTNLRGALTKSRSRGDLVREFVVGSDAPRAYGDAIAGAAEGYAGFHLLVGLAGEDLVYVTPESSTVLTRGVHAVSNAPAGEQWPKMALALGEMEAVLAESDPEAIVTTMLAFLTGPRSSGAIESEPFVIGERYGTRSSSVIVVAAGAIVFAEQTFGPGGVAVGDVRRARIIR